MKRKRRRLKVIEAKDLDLGRPRRAPVSHPMRRDEPVGTRPMSVFFNEMKNVSKL